LPGEALLNEKRQTEILVDNEPTDRSGIYYGMMTCTPKRRLADITAEVKAALNPPVGGQEMNFHAALKTGNLLNL
jgi:hypothetical protein